MVLSMKFYSEFIAYFIYAVDLSEVNGKEQMEAQPAKKGRGRKQ